MARDMAEQREVRIADRRKEGGGERRAQREGELF